MISVITSEISKAFGKLFQFVSKPFCIRWANESQQLFSGHTVRGIEFIGPEHYLPVLELTIDALQRSSPDAATLVQQHITTIYAHPNPVGWIEFGNHCIFISSEMEKQTAFVWNDLAGFLAKTAKIDDLLNQDHVSVLFKWSRCRKRVRKFEREVISALEVMQGTRGYRQCESTAPLGDA